MIDAIEMLGLASIPFFILLDLAHRAREFQSPRFWRLRALLVTAASFILSILFAGFWSDVLGDRHLFDLSGLGMLGGAVVGILVYQLFHYLYHRLAHGWDPLWRWAHQMHHSAESVDAWGAYYLHPFDTFFFTTWASLVFFPLLGLSGGAGVIGASFLTFNAMFQHANIRTPRWVGYIIQRPESHQIHHGRGVHRYNYADLPLWDMVFGTFRNPSAWDSEAGFYDGASSRLTEMLVGKDVSEPERISGAESPSRVLG